MEWTNRIDRLQFNNHIFSYKQIKPVTIFKFDFFIPDRNGFLPFDFYTFPFKFKYHAFFIG